MPVSRYTEDILKSLKGNLLGLDRLGRLVGHNGIREPQESLTAASTMDRTGTSVLSGSTAVFTLMAPLKPGILKEIITASTVSTATMSIVRSTAEGACSFLANTSGTTSVSDVVRINLISASGSRVLLLRSISTAVWAPLTKYTSAEYTISTSS